MSDETQKKTSSVNDAIPLPDNALPDGVIARITLKKPITDQEGNAIKVLEIKEPTGADYVRIGDPFNMSPTANGGFSMQTNTKNMLAYLAACTGVHGPLLQTLSVKDLMRATGAIAGFLGQE